MSSSSQSPSMETLKETNLESKSIPTEIKSNIKIDDKDIKSNNQDSKVVELIDLLKNKTTKISLYNGAGYVILYECMPRLYTKSTADSRICEAARVSYGVLELKSDEDDIRLINYLMEHWHTSPFEVIKFGFIIQIPIYVARQLIRHRTANVNEYSMRYTTAIDEFYFPPIRYQDDVNKQGSIPLDKKMELLNEEEKSNLNKLETKYFSAQKKSSELLDDYKELVDLGLAREVARTILPVSEMTKLYWHMDLHNLFHFLRLRMDKHAQKEIQDLANAIYELVYPIVPAACEAFKKFRLNSVMFSSDEHKVVKRLYQLDSSKWSEKIVDKICSDLKLKFSKRQVKDLLQKARAE